MNWWNNLPITPEPHVKKHCAKRFSPEENGMFDQCLNDVARGNYCRKHWFGSLDDFEALEKKYNDLKQAYQDLLKKSKP